MSEIRRNDEHWKDNLIGCTFTKKLEAAMMTRHSLELAVDRAETRAKRAREVLKGLEGQPMEAYSAEVLRVLESVSEGSAVTCMDTNGKILDVGFSCANDLILDNFGLWLAGFIHTGTAAANTNFPVTLKNTANASKLIYMYHTSGAFASVFNSNASGASEGTQLQVGSGTTGAARADYKIETAFGTAPESAAFSTNIGSYTSGAITFSGAITAGGNGTVNEMALLAVWMDSVPSSQAFALFHDILSSGVAFVAGNPLVGSCAITL